MRECITSGTADGGELIRYLTEVRDLSAASLSKSGI
jgi:hypothetical protein